jgi:hypothetical protein
MQQVKTLRSSIKKGRPSSSIESKNIAAHIRHTVPSAVNTTGLPKRNPREKDEVTERRMAWREKLNQPHHGYQE